MIATELGKSSFFTISALYTWMIRISNFSAIAPTAFRLLIIIDSFMVALNLRWDYMDIIVMRRWDIAMLTWHYHSVRWHLKVNHSLDRFPLNFDTYNWDQPTCGIVKSVCLLTEAIIYVFQWGNSEMSSSVFSLPSHYGATAERRTQERSRVRNSLVPLGFFP